MSEFTLGVAFGVLYGKLVDLGKDSAREAALAWIKSNRGGYGSFAWVCEELGLEIQPARLRILAADLTGIQDLLKTFREEIRAHS